MSVHTAHGKVILLGEHAVVFGHPCLAAAIRPGVEASAREAEGLELHISPWEKTFRPGDGSDLGRALGVLAERLGVTDAALSATMYLPGGGGLGSSAALGVACARALSELRMDRGGGEKGGLRSEPEARVHAPSPPNPPSLDEATLLDAALAWERVFHGNPSGVDHTLAALGGIGVFVKGEGLRRVSPRGRLSLCLGDTGERASTKEMVATVARQRERRPEATEQSFDAIARLVRNAALALPAGDYKTLGDLMNLNQMLLSSLMVSTERIEELCAAARAAGAWGAKLTGAGGGGCVVAVADEGSRDAVLDAWRALGAKAWTVEVGA